MKNCIFNKRQSSWKHKPTCKHFANPEQVTICLQILCFAKYIHFISAEKSDSVKCDDLIPSMSLAVDLFSRSALKGKVAGDGFNYE